MNVEIRTEAAQFPEKEDINGIFLAVQVYMRKIFRLFVTNMQWPWLAKM